MLRGIALTFPPEVRALSFDDDAVCGIAWAVAGIVAASLGNMAAVVNTRRVQPVVTVNAHAMPRGAAASALLAVLLRREFTILMTPGYVLSLLYLALFGSSVTFGLYLTLIRRIGAARAAYASVLFPAVSLSLSTVFEDYRWSALAASGIVLTMAGNWLGPATGWR